MGFFNFNHNRLGFFDLFKRGYKATRRNDGTWSYFLDSSGNLGYSGHYLTLSLENIALFTALDIRSTMFSRGKVFVKDKEGNVLEDDPLMKLLKNPNFAQSTQDFLYSHLWFKGLGNNVMRAVPNKPGAKVDVRNIENVASLENLIPSCIDYKDINKVKEFVISRSQIKGIEDREIKYEASGIRHMIKVSQLAFFYDVTNNMTDESYFKSPSRITALLPALMNISEAEQAKNVNLKHSKKWLITNYGMEEGLRESLKPGEKQEMEDRWSNKDITATNATIKAESLAPDMRRLLYDDGVASEAMKVFGGYNIPKDVINWWMNGQTTHDNKKYALAEWVSGSIQFEATDWGNTLANFFGYSEEGKTVGIDYSDDPVMQVLEEKRIESLKTRAEIAKVLFDMQVPTERALKISGLEKEMKDESKD